VYKFTDAEARSGYIKDFSFNPDWKEQKCTCGYEHCIELMPLTKSMTKKSCKIFGHNCPGGSEMVEKCGKTIYDIPIERITRLSHN
jgi:hypothetical protein